MIKKLCSVCCSDDLDFVNGMYICNNCYETSKIVIEINEESGLTVDEAKIVDNLASCFNKSMLLNLSKKERELFAQSINDAMSVFSERALKRAYPNFWR